MNNHYQSLGKLVEALRRCRRYPQMQFSPVSGGPVSGRVILVDKLPEPARPFAWTAGKTLFRRFADVAGIDEDSFRATVYLAACFAVSQVAARRDFNRSFHANPRKVTI
jgi:uracil-DNA glycosylase